MQPPVGLDNPTGQSDWAIRSGDLFGESDVTVGIPQDSSLIDCLKEMSYQGRRHIANKGVATRRGEGV